MKQPPRQLPFSNRLTTNWSNHDNANFYDTITMDLLYEWEKLAGLETALDLDVIMNYVQKSNSILELGAGYGRIINALLSRGYTKEIYAVERCKRFFDILTSRFNSAKVNLLNVDINNLNIDKTFDVILWMWTGFCEFSASEQTKILTRIKYLLNPSGTIFIDSFTSTPRNACRSNGKNHVFSSDHTNENILLAYYMSQNELQSYAKHLGFSHIKFIHYTTLSKRTRYICALTK